MNNTILYSIDSKGKTRQWRAYTDYSLDDNGYMTITVEHGVLDGKLQTKERKVKSGKNIGKANETSLKQQTDLEIGYLYTKQFDDGYVTDLNMFKKVYKPMLAHKYDDRKHTIDWNNNKYYSSTKLDGIRCFVIINKDGSINFISRTGKPFKYLEHIADSVKQSPIYKDLKTISNNTNPVYILDGELYSEDLEFPEITSIINNDTYNFNTDKEVKFYMYDFIDLDSVDDSFITRLDKFWNSIETPLEYVEYVEQHLTESEDKMKELFSQFVSDGYEGLMLKANHIPYEFDKRSNALLKYKEMLTDEFQIVDIYLAENDNTRVQITLKTSEGKTFDVGTVKGSREDVYNKYYLNKDSLIGKFGTVQYQTMSIYNVPLFPVFIDIREGVVMNGQFIPSV